MDITASNTVIFVASKAWTYVALTLCFKLKSFVLSLHRFVRLLSISSNSNATGARFNAEALCDEEIKTTQALALERMGKLDLNPLC